MHRLEGAELAHLDYDDPALRFFGDIDLLVRSADWERSAATLVAVGYRRRFREIRPGFDRRFGKGVSFEGPQLRQIDLHRTFVSGPFGLTIDLEEVWSATTTFELGGRTLLALDTDHRFLHACYHAAVGKREPQLVPLRDLAGMLERRSDPVDFDRVRGLAREWGVEAIVARAVVHAADRLRLTETDASSWASRYQPTRREARAMRTYLDPDIGFAARSLVALSALDGTVTKLRYAGSLAFPSASFGRGRHGTRFARWFDAVKQAARLGWRTRR